MPVFERDGVSLGYDDSAGSGPAIVLLHGLSVPRASWARFLPDLQDRFRVVLLDQRGHGESSHHPGTYVLDNYIDDTLAFLEEVVGEPAFLIGHSLGGVIAHGVMQLRADLVRAALLEDPPLYVVARMVDQGLGRSEASSVAAMFPLMQQVCRDMQAREAPLSEYEAMVAAAPALNRSGRMRDVLGTEGVRVMAEGLSRLDPEVFTEAIEGSAISGRPDPSVRLERPVVVVRADPALGPAFTASDETRFLETNPRARVLVFEGSSHQIHDEQPQRFLDEILALTAMAST